jgi:hypothetical protein
VTTESKDIRATRAGDQSLARIGLPKEVHRHLGLGLRALYAELLSDPIPDRFLELLRRLEAKEKVS